MPGVVANRPDASTFFQLPPPTNGAGTIAQAIIGSCRTRRTIPVNTLSGGSWMHLSRQPKSGTRRALQAAAAAVSALIAATILVAQAARSDPDRGRFDGVWTTILSCPNSNGALGYSFEFPATVKDGLLHAEKGTRGQPGWLQLDGKILDDGSADLYASGIVGAAPFAVGQRPAGTGYGYHVAAQFTPSSATGHRVEGRPCSVVFSRSP